MIKRSRLVIGLVVVAMILVSVPAILTFRSRPEPLKELGKYVPLIAFHNPTILDYKEMRFPNFPEHHWRFSFSSFDSNALAEAGFKGQDEAEKAYLQKIMQEEFPEQFSAGGDTLIAKELRQFNAFILLHAAKRECFVYVTQP